MSCNNLRGVSSKGLYVDKEGFLRDESGNKIVLRGLNLGGWMIQESWMCPVTGNDRGWANLDTIKAMESRGWTDAQIQELFSIYQDNWITEDDFNFFMEKGVNCIRIPFWYRNFMSDESGAWINEDDGSKTKTINPGFTRLDWAVKMAKNRGIYIILDFHGAAGGQSMDHSCGTLGKNELYTVSQYEDAAVKLWSAIAGRYKNESAVAAYDLLNEPQNNGGYAGTNAWEPGSDRAVHETVRLYDRLYREIRAVDANTIIIMEAIWDMNLPNPEYVHSGELDVNARYSGKTASWDKNVMYSMHLYDHSKQAIQYRINELIKTRSRWKVAVHAGEFNNNNEGNQAFAYSQYNIHQINWNMWTYKIAGANMGNWSLYQAGSKPKADPVNDGFNTIMDKWGKTLRTFTPGTNEPANGFTATGMLKYFSDGLLY
ncbi:MAG: glycoside hydrolase family 5 protein [Treponema sp.]|nr:glycoside hydrolase family 5 protein [Treponema sp.]